MLIKIVNMKLHIGLNPSGGNCDFATDWRTGTMRLIGVSFSRNCFVNVLKNDKYIVFLKLHLEMKDPPEVGLTRITWKAKKLPPLAALRLGRTLCTLLNGNSFFVVPLHIRICETFRILRPTDVKQMVLNYNRIVGLYNECSH